MWVVIFLYFHIKRTPIRKYRGHCSAQGGLIPNFRFAPHTQLLLNMNPVRTLKFTQILSF